MDIETRRDQRRTTPRVPTGTWAKSKGGKGRRMEAGHGSGSRHAERGAETSGGIWRVTGGGKSQVDDYPLREKM